MARKSKQKKVVTGRSHYQLRSRVKKVVEVKAATAAATKKRQAASRKAAAAKDELKCSICLDTHQYKVMTPMPCGHSFHKRCINNWVKVSQSCPICRKPVLKHQSTSTSQQFRVEVTEHQPENTDSAEYQNIASRVAVVFAAFVPFYSRRSRHL